MAITEIYVDPNIDDDTGTGLIGDPYGDLEFAIEQATLDLSNGTRVNIKAGTDEILAVELSAAMADTGTSIAWVPTNNARCIFQGYTLAAGDGGIGGISGGGSVGIISSVTLDYITFLDLHLHNCGSQTIVKLDDNCYVIGCEVNNTSGDGIFLERSCLLFGSYLHDIGTRGVSGMSRNSYAAYNFLKNGTKKFTRAFDAMQIIIFRNIISLDSNSDGIHFGATGGAAIANSIFSNGGSGQGLILNGNAVGIILTNNIVEGFSASGGIGFDLDASNTGAAIWGGNAAFNNATDYALFTGHVHSDLGDNEVLLASPFLDAVGDNFSPFNIGSVKEGSLPQIIGGGFV